MTFGQIIKHSRKKAGLTQRQLAEKLGISFVNISQIENGHRIPKPDTVIKIANAIGLPPVDLLQVTPGKEASEHIKTAYTERYGPLDRFDGLTPSSQLTDEEYEAWVQAQLAAEGGNYDGPTAADYEEMRQDEERASRLGEIIDSLPVGKYSVAMTLLESVCSNIIFEDENPLLTFLHSDNPFFEGRPKMNVARRQYFITADPAALTYAEIKEAYIFMKETIGATSPGQVHGGGQIHTNALRLFEAAFGDIALHSPEKAGAKPPAP